MSRLSADFGYVFDHASPIGEIVHRVADLLLGRGALPRAGRPRRDPARGRPQRDRRGGARDRGHAASAGSTPRRPRTWARSDGGTAANVVAERCYVELETRSLDDDKRGRGGERDGRRARRGGERLRVRRRDLGRAPVPGLPAAAHRARGRGGGGGAARQRASSRPTSTPAAAATPTSSSRPACPCVNLANGTERNHQPDESVTVEALETMLDVTSRWSQAARVAAQSSLERLMERIGGEVVWEGRHHRVRVDRFRYDDGEEAEREIVEHPGAVGDRGARRRDASTWCASRARPWASRAARAAGRASSTRRARSRSTPRKRELAEEIGKGARNWQHLTSFYTSPGFTDEECHLFLATDLYDESAEADENERIEIVRVPLAQLDDAIRDCRDAKTLVGLLWFRASSALSALIAAEGLQPACWRETRRRGRRSSKPDRRAPVRAPRARLPRLPRVRARAVAQHARGLPLRPAPVRRASWRRAAVARSTPTPRDVVRLPRPGSPRATPSGRRRRRPRSTARPPACAPSTATCAARACSTPTRPPRSRAAAQPQAAAGAHARRGARSCSRSRSGTEPAALRDRALLELMYACGLRASEAIGLELADVDLEERRAARARQGVEGAHRAGRPARRCGRVRAYLGAAGRSWSRARVEPHLFVNFRGGAAHAPGPLQDRPPPRARPRGSRTG